MVPFLAQIKAPAVKLPKASTLCKNAKVKAAEADAESWISAHGLTVAAIILAVILIGVLVYMIRQRRKKTPEELTTEVIEPQSLGLVRVWKEFILQLTLGGIGRPSIYFSPMSFLDPTAVGKRP